jgi:hypothetical protein
VQETRSQRKGSERNYGIGADPLNRQVDDRDFDTVIQETGSIRQEPIRHVRRYGEDDHPGGHSPR